MHEFIETQKEWMKDIPAFRSGDTLRVNVRVKEGDKERIQYIKNTLNNLPANMYELAVKRKILPYELLSNGQDKLVVITPDTTHPEIHTVARAFQFTKYEIKHVELSLWNELWRQLAFDQGAKQLGLQDDHGLAAEAEGTSVLRWRGILDATSDREQFPAPAALDFT